MTDTSHDAPTPRSPLAFVDTETDGVHPDRAIWEAAVVRREPDGSETSWEAFVEIDLSTADPFGLRVGGFYDRHPLGRELAGLPRLPGGAPITREQLAKKVGKLTHAAHFIGAVPSFDSDILDRDMRDEGLLGAWHYHLADVENLAVGYLAGQGRPLLPPWSSSDITEMLGVAPATPEERHTAMGDVRWAMRLWDRIMDGATAGEQA